MLDVTDAFREAVEHSEQVLGKFAERRVPGSSKGFSDAFNEVSREVLKRLQSTQTTVLDLVDAYGSFDEGKGFSDEKRDAFDAKLAEVVKTERVKVDGLRDAVSRLGLATSGSFLEHKHVVVEVLYQRLQILTKLIGGLQLLRMRHTLAAKKSLYSSSTGGGVDEQLIESLVRNAQEETETVRRRKKEPVNKTSEGYSTNFDDELGSDEEGDSFDAETVQMLESEQVALRARLQREVEEVKQAERQMGEFSELLTVFNDKVAEQSESVSNIFAEVEKSTDYMRKATDQLHQAKQHNSSFRFYVLIFFAIASGLLLLYDRMD